VDDRDVVRVAGRGGVHAGREAGAPLTQDLSGLHEFQRRRRLDETDASHDLELVSEISHGGECNSGHTWHFRESSILFASSYRRVDTAVTRRPRVGPAPRRPASATQDLARP